MAVVTAQLERFAWPAASVGFCLLATKIASIGLITLCLFGALYCAFAFVRCMQTERAATYVKSGCDLIQGLQNELGTEVAACRTGQCNLFQGLAIGSRVERGQLLGTITALKMISQIIAPLSGEIEHLDPRLGGGPVDVNGGAVLLRIRGDLS